MRETSIPTTIVGNEHIATNHFRKEVFCVNIEVAGSLWDLREVTEYIGG